MIYTTKFIEIKNWKLKIVFGNLCMNFHGLILFMIAPLRQSSWRTVHCNKVYIHSFIQSELYIIIKYNTLV